MQKMSPDRSRLCPEADRFRSSAYKLRLSAEIGHLILEAEIVGIVSSLTLNFYWRLGWEQNKAFKLFCFLNNRISREARSNFLKKWLTQAFPVSLNQ